MKKFDNVSVEQNTTVLSSIVTKFGDIDCLYQVWVWDGIKGESVIFVADEVKDIPDLELCSTPLIKDVDDVTFSRNRDGYTFVNFNFEVMI